MPANLPVTKPRKRKAESGKLNITDKIKIALMLRNLIHKTKTMKIHGSWKTSLFGAGGLATILFNVASMLLDGDAATNPDWSVTIPAVITAAALLFAKDSNVSNAPHPRAHAQKVD